MNEENYWFKKRSHIWQPISWQGWLTVVAFLLTIAGNASIIILLPYSNELLWLYLNTLILAVALLLLIGYHKGPRG